MRTLLVGFILLTCPSSHLNGAITDTTKISARYDIEVTDLPVVPKFLSGVIGKVFQFVNFAPKDLSYFELITGLKNENDDFLMELWDQDGKKWLHATSNISETSFAEPPKSKRDTLNSNGVKFISELREFFRSPKTIWLNASFRFGKDTLRISVFHDTSAKSDTAYRAYKPSLYRFSSSDDKGKPYLRCEFLVGSKNGIVVYPRVDAYLYDKGIGLKMTLRQLEIIGK
ncbi:MAG: hypothetical protein ABSF47_01900 [Minisyncoccia bacterium]|jgi:hypothetical protein